MKNINKPPLIVVIGPTASGKTSLAIELARKYNGEIICADSRTIYKGMDIGTAKPTDYERSLVSHYGLDLVEPGEYFSASDFKKYADRKIAEIRQRGHIPFLVGGTGLYIDSVIFNYSFGSKADSDLRQKLNNMTVPELHDIYNNLKIEIPENKLNKRHLVRGIERNGIKLQSRDRIIDNKFVVGISTEKSILTDRIHERSEQMFQNGVVDEAIKLSNIYGWDSEAMTGSIYKLARKYLSGELTFDEMKRKNETADWQLAKRQITWFKRNKFIHWGSLDYSKTYTIELLEKNH